MSRFTHTGNKFSGVYDVTNPFGLVEVNEHIDAYLVDRGYTTSITIKREPLQIVQIEGTLDSKIVHNYESDSFYGVENRIWIPWCDDSIIDSKEYGQRNIKSVLRGGNRLNLEIRNPGKYDLIVPYDADLKVNFKTGDIVYNSIAPTHLHVDCSKVNKCGYTGHNASSGVSWSYDISDGAFKKHSPVTKLRTKGNVTILP